MVDLGNTKQRVTRLAAGIMTATALMAWGYGTSWSDVAPVEQSTWFINKSEFAKSAHAAFSCLECHTAMTGEDKKHPDPQAQGFLHKEKTRLYDYSSCKRCHPQAYTRYLTGAHAKALREELNGSGEKSVDHRKLAAPTCGNCHSSHYAKAHLSQAEAGKWMVETCGSCHPEETRTYLENYHGKTAVYHGAEESAYCSDCHGAHECTSLKERVETLKACQRCHPSAESQFAGFVIHATTDGSTEAARDKTAKVTLIHRIESIGIIFVISILGFFYFHSLAWFLRKMHEKLRKR